MEHPVGTGDFEPLHGETVVRVMAEADPGVGEMDDYPWSGIVAFPDIDVIAGLVYPARLDVGPAGEGYNVGMGESVSQAGLNPVDILEGKDGELVGHFLLPAGMDAPFVPEGFSDRHP